MSSNVLILFSEPLFLSCSEIDHTFPPESRNKAVDILQKAGKPYQLQVFSGVEHGFALRCNLDNAYERKWSIFGKRAVARVKLTLHQVTPKSRQVTSNLGESRGSRPTTRPDVSC